MSADLENVAWSKLFKSEVFWAPPPRQPRPEIYLWHQPACGMFLTPERRPALMAVCVVVVEAQYFTRLVS